jgi:hypothetical protein
MGEETTDRRSESRVPVRDFYGVELTLPNLEYVHQFGLWNLSNQGLCILIRPDSRLLKALTVGLVLDMKFYGPEDASVPRTLKAEIKHITQAEEGRFRNHVLVGVSIVEGAPLE